MRRRVAGLAGVLCGFCLVSGCTSGAVDPVGQDRVYGPQPRASAPVWPGLTGVTVGDQSSRWWPVSSARDLHPTGIEVVASSEDVGGMAVDGSGVVWVDVPWGLVRLDPGTWSATAWDVGDDAVFASKEFVRASSGAGVWLAGQDRVRLFDGIRFVRDIQVPAGYLGEVREGEARVRDVVEVGSELWIATATGVARCDGHSWSAVGEGQLDDVGRLLLTPWGEVWAGSWTPGGSMRWTRYDGSRWAPIDRPGYWPMRAIVGDPTGGIMAAFGSEVLRYDGSEWKTLLQLDDADGADGRAEAIAASGDGTAWAIVVEDRTFLQSLLRSDGEGHGHPIAAPDGMSPTAVAVSGDTVVVSADTGVYRVAGDVLERVWSPQLRGAVVGAQLIDVVPVSGDEAWILTEDWSVEGGLVQLWRVQVGSPNPVLVASLPESAAQTFWGWPLPSLGSAAVPASDGALWYVTEEAVIRVASGTESVVASRSSEDLADAYVVNVNVVATEQGGPERADPRPREIGPDAFVELTVPGTAITQTLYGDGDIHCPNHWAHDLSLPVGQVQYTPTPQAVEITVTLTQAWPDTEYYVEVNTDQFCQGQQDGTGDRRFGGLVTDGDGAGSLTLTYLPTSDYAARLPAVALLAGDAGSVWVLSTEPGWLEPGDRQPSEEASLEGLRLLAPEGGSTQVDLPAPARDIMLLAVGAGDHLWATVCEGGTEPDGWGIPTCPGGWRLMHWEAEWMLVAYPGADLRGRGATPDGGFWAVLADATGQFDHGVLAHYREGSWTTLPELANADDSNFDPDEYAVTPAGSVCRIDAERPTLICVDPTLQISRTPVGVTGKVAAAADGAVWVWDNQGLMRVPITVP
jgi:hypothetical protein